MILCNSLWSFNLNCAAVGYHMIDRYIIIEQFFFIFLLLFSIDFFWIICVLSWCCRDIGGVWKLVEIYYLIRLLAFTVISAPKGQIPFTVLLHTFHFQLNTLLFLSNLIMFFFFFFWNSIFNGIDITLKLTTTRKVL